MSLRAFKNKIGRKDRLKFSGLSDRVTPILGVYIDVKVEPPAYMAAALRLCGLDHAARDLFAGRAARLSMHIVRAYVYDHGQTDNIGYLESVGQNAHIRAAAVFEQRRQIARVIWVLAAVWVIMRKRVRKFVLGVSRAAFSAVYMEREHAVFAFLAGMGQAAHVGCYHNSGVYLLKSYFAFYIWVFT